MRDLHPGHDLKAGSPSLPIGQKEPTTSEVVPLRRYEWYDSSKALRELGLPRTPAREALRKAVEWYWDQGYAP